jgi:hypothetical protein
MLKPPTSFEDIARYQQDMIDRIGTAGAADDDWMSTLSKIAPIVSGVGTFGSFINSVIAARQTAAFQAELISALQTIESDLEGIKSDLDAIYDELKKIETQIAGLGLNDKLTAIENWGAEMAALEPGDTAGAQNLATAMMDASQGASNLLGCMTGLHNALVGAGIGQPLINLLDPPGFLQIRGRLAQGLHLLAFGCAFNTQERYDYSVFLLQWAANFELQSQFYFASGKDAFPIGDDTAVPVGDTIVVTKYAQITLDNVAVAADGTGETLMGYTGPLGWALDGNQMVVVFPNAVPGSVAAFDLVSNEASPFPDSPVYRRCNPFIDGNRYLWVFLKYFGGFLDETWASRGKLLSGARFDQNQTFLGAVNGQLNLLSAADEAPYLCSIHDGENTGASLLAFDATRRTVSAVPRTQLKTLAQVLWAVSWVAKDVVTIAALQPDNAAAAYLALDGGVWTISPSAVNLTVKAAAPILGKMVNPFTMPPTTATIGGAAGSNRTVLFHQL